MFLLGIGGHLKVSHMDPRVSFGNESTNLSVRKSFFKIIAPYSEGQIEGIALIAATISGKYSSPADCVGGVDLGYRPNGPVAVHLLAHSHHLQGRKEREDIEGFK